MLEYPFFKIGDTLFIEYEDYSGAATKRKITIHDLEISRKDIRIDAYCHLRKGPRQFLGRRIALAYTLDGEIIPHRDVFKNMVKNPAEYLVEPKNEVARTTKSAKKQKYKEPLTIWEFLFKVWTLVYVAWMLFMGIGYLGLITGDGDKMPINVIIGIFAGLPTVLHLYFLARRKRSRA